MKNSSLTILALALAGLVSLSACSISAFEGYRYRIVGNKSAQSIDFDCKIATHSGQCHISIAPDGTTMPVSQIVAAGQRKTINNAPVGALYCVAEQAVVWADCTKANVNAGTTTVESGRSARAMFDSHTLQSNHITEFFGFH
jgi:hypothetical protein